MIQYSKQALIMDVHNASLSYKEKMILRDINFQIHDIVRPDKIQGQIVSICGRSGIGKTSLFKLLAGFQNPDKGEVKIGESQKLVQMGDVGVVPQDYRIFLHRTVKENLELGLRKNKTLLAQHSPSIIIEQYASHFGIEEHLNKYPSQISGGQRQRVSILQQVLSGNQFILLDEPFSGLDVLVKDKVIELLIEVANLSEHNTLIVVSHDIEASCAISDTVFILGNEPEKTGATIIREYCLLEMGIAYHPDIKSQPLFQNLIKEIKSIL